MNGWSARALLIASCLSLTACAAVFRDSTAKVRFESDPTPAEVAIEGKAGAPTPGELAIERSGATTVVVRKAGYQDYRTIVKKKMNGAWLTIDILDCLVTLCIPLIVDAGTGAWWDLPKTQMVRLDPLPPAPVAPLPIASAAPPASAPTPIVTPLGPAPGAQMSESERKAAARAAFIEGVALQNEQKDCKAAIARFEAAQKLVTAPTHLVHMAQCQVQLGRLLEAQENYETVSRMVLASNAPEAFKEAHDLAKRELPGVKKRVPTLRVQMTPAPPSIKGLVVQVNGTTMPVELVGIARPINPGTYRVTCAAPGWRQAENVEIKVDEGTNRVADVKMIH